VYVPADDLTRPVAGDHVRPPRRDRLLSRDIASLGIYPAVEPARLDVAPGRPNVIARSTTRNTRGGAGRAGSRYKELRDIIAILGMDELSPEDS